MLGVFLEVVLPVIIVAALGGLVGRLRNVSVGPLSTLVFYLFTPALVFSSLSRTELSAGVGLSIVVVMLAAFATMLVASSAWSALRGHDPSMRAGVALAATSPNVGNMGLPVVALAFGDVGLQVAVVNFVIGAVLVNTAGVAIASTAGGEWRRSLTAAFRYPQLYAAVAAIVVRLLDVELPTAISVPAESLGAAAIPVMLVVLGLQLKDGVELDKLADTGAVTAGRLLLAPLAAWLAATALELDDITRATLVVLAAMPTAVVAIIIATEFRAQPAFVTRVVVASTIVSLLTLTVLIDLVR